MSEVIAEGIDLVCRIAAEDRSSVDQRTLPPILAS
jgi:hypothetical protein